jgi:hypothetical protein
MPLIHTTHGAIDEGLLSRSLVFTELESEFSIVIEWRLKADLASTVFDPATRETRRVENAAGDVVKRSAHVILKEPSVIADAIAASVG